MQTGWFISGLNSQATAGCWMIKNSRAAHAIPPLRLHAAPRAACMVLMSAALIPDHRKFT